MEAITFGRASSRRKKTLLRILVSENHVMVRKEVLGQQLVFGLFVSSGLVCLLELQNRGAVQKFPDLSQILGC